ncbi:hypothetical protein JW979_07490 [bacterium]|nr:hypothetical protein [candidate division CSSED10-310 bacterium]
MRSIKIFIIGILFSYLGFAVANADVLERRDIQVVYDYQQITDGFGNIRTIIISGYVKNKSDQDVARVHVMFKLVWQERNPIFKKLRFKNIPSDAYEEFQFEIDLGARPDALKQILVDLEKIKFTTARQVSPKTEHNITTHEKYSLQEITEEGKRFDSLIMLLKSLKPFNDPPKDEFETSDEYETRVNYIENEHFDQMMDELETRYGELLGGPNAIVRFIPKTVNKELIYVTENSIYFQIHVKFGKYNADKRRFEDINLDPRTIIFDPPTILPSAEMKLDHKNGLFYLSQPFMDVGRSEGRSWRKNESNIVLEVTLRLGVIQDGPYPESKCFVEAITLKNIKSGDVYRKWGWESI